MKTSSEEVKTLEITFPDFLQVSVVTLLKYYGRKEREVCCVEVVRVLCTVNEE